MDRRTFLLSAAGAGLGIFVPRPVVTVFDMGRLQEPFLEVCHTFWHKELGYWEYDGTVWKRLDKEAYMAFNTSCQYNVPAYYQREGETGIRLAGK